MMVGKGRSAGLLAALAFGVGTGFATAWWWQANNYQRQLALQAAAFQVDLATIAKAGAAQVRQALEQQQRAASALAELDRQYTQEKEQAHAENKALRRAVADGTRRLRIAGDCPADPQRVSGSAGTPGVDDAGAVELAPAAGRAVLDIRSGIIADQAALKALQEYVGSVCQVR